MENSQPSGFGHDNIGINWRFLFRSRRLILGIASSVLIVAVVDFVWAYWQASTKLAPQQSGWASIDSSQSLIRLSGSKTIGSQLVPELVTAWLVSIGASDVEETHRLGPDGNKIPESLIRARLNGNPVVVEVKAHGSAAAFTDMINGDADIGMASREINSSELSQLMPLGYMRSAASEHVLGLEGIAVIVPQSNTISALSRSNLKKIFTGQITNWSAVGMKNLPIHLYARSNNASSYGTFASLVLGDVPMANAKHYEDSEKLESDVASDPGGIGFIGMPYVKDTRAILISDGTTAARETPPNTASHALSRRLYLYTAAVPQNPSVIDFVRFALTPEGQSILRKDRFAQDLGEGSEFLNDATNAPPPRDNVKATVTEENIKQNHLVSPRPPDVTPPPTVAIVPEVALDVTKALTPITTSRPPPLPPAPPPAVAIVPEVARDVTTARTPITTSRPPPMSPAAPSVVAIVPEVALGVTEASLTPMTTARPPLLPPAPPPPPPVVKVAPPPTIQPVATTSHVVTVNDYPILSMIMQDQGKVLIKYLVQEDGSVGDCNVITSSGKPLLDDAACSMVKRHWKFKPATRGGKPVAEFLTAEVTFRLK